MSDALYQRTRHLAGSSTNPDGRPLPRGIGLSIGLAASLGLWAGGFWAIARLFS